VLTPRVATEGLAAAGGTSEDSHHLGREMQARSSDQADVRLPTENASRLAETSRSAATSTSTPDQTSRWNPA
jgi:hypothetical protein